MSSSFSLLVHHKPGLHITFPLLQAIKHPSQHAHCCLFTHEFYVRSRVAKESIMFEHFNCNIYIYIYVYLNMRVKKCNAENTKDEIQQ